MSQTSFFDLRPKMSEWAYVLVLQQNSEQNKPKLCWHNLQQVELNTKPFLRKCDKGFLGILIQ